LRRGTGKSLAILSLAIVSLAACGGGSSLLDGVGENPEAAAMRDLGMEGRWILTAPNAPTCGLTFTGPPGANEGRITPDGGCPERFFLARRWRLAEGALSVVGADDAVLGVFRAVGGRFEGKSGAETPLTLSR